MVKRAILAFTGLFALLSLLMSAINWWVMTLNSGAAIGVLMASGIGAAGVFVKQMGRQPNRAERHQLALWCTLVAYAVSALIFFLVVWLLMSPAEWQVLREQLAEISFVIMAAVTALMSLVYYGALRLVFGLLSRKCYKVKGSDDEAKKG